MAVEQVRANPCSCSERQICTRHANCAETCPSARNTCRFLGPRIVLTGSWLTLWASHADDSFVTSPLGVFGMAPLSAELCSSGCIRVMRTASSCSRRFPGTRPWTSQRAARAERQRFPRLRAGLFSPRMPASERLDWIAWHLPCYTGIDSGFIPFIPCGSGDSIVRRPHLIPPRNTVQARWHLSTGLVCCAG